LDNQDPILTVIGFFFVDFVCFTYAILLKFIIIKYCINDWTNMGTWATDRKSM